jgi:hypothetical protein
MDGACNCTANTKILHILLVGRYEGEDLGLDVGITLISITLMCQVRVSTELSDSVSGSMIDFVIVVINLRVKIVEKFFSS